MGHIRGEGFLKQLTLLSVHGPGRGRKLPRLLAGQLVDDALSRRSLKLDGAVTPQDELIARFEACSPRVGEQAGVMGLGRARDLHDAACGSWTVGPCKHLACPSTELRIGGRGPLQFQRGGAAVRCDEAIGFKARRANSTSATPCVAGASDGDVEEITTGTNWVAVWVSAVQASRCVHAI